MSVALQYLRYQASISANHNSAQEILVSVDFAMQFWYQDSMHLQLIQTAVIGSIFIVVLTALLLGAGIIVACGKSRSFDSLDQFCDVWFIKEDCRTWGGHARQSKEGHRKHNTGGTC